MRSLLLLLPLAVACSPALEGADEEGVYGKSGKSFNYLSDCVDKNNDGDTLDAGECDDESMPPDLRVTVGPGGNGWHPGERATLNHIDFYLAMRVDRIDFGLALDEDSATRAMDSNSADYLDVLVSGADSESFVAEVGVVMDRNTEKEYLAVWTTDHEEGRDGAVHGMMFAMSEMLDENYTEVGFSDDKWGQEGDRK